MISLNLASQEFVNTNKHHNYCSRGTLIILPINLPDQWTNEIERFYKKDTYTLIKLLSTADLKKINMDQLLNADIVLTTIHFIKSNKTYNDILSGLTNTKGLAKKSRALFNSIARNKNIESPLIQLVNWNRIIVDEIHEIKDRDLRILKNLSAEVFWGLTATPNFNTADELNHLNFMNEDILWHPNILKSYVNKFMLGHKNIMKNLPDNALNLVQVSENEKKNIDNKNEEETIILTTSFDDTVSFFIKPEERKIIQSKMKLFIERRSVIASSIIISAIWCAEQFGTSKICSKIIYKKMIDTLFNEQKQKINGLYELLQIIKQTKKRKIFMEKSLLLLESRTETCPICMDTCCSVVTKCGHIFCMKCISAHYTTKDTCPICKNESNITDVFRILNDNENSKLNAIKNMVDSVEDPIIS